MKGTVKKLSKNSTKYSISKEQLQGGPLTKQDILEIYADVFTRIRKFPGLPYKLSQIQSPLDMYQGKCLYICKMLSMRRSEIWNN